MRLTSKNLVSLAMFMVLIILAGCSGIRTLDKTNIATIPIADLESDPEKYGFPAAIYGEGIIAKVPKGTKIPLKVEASASLITLEPGENFVSFNRDVYIFISAKKAMLSPDGERWAELRNWNAVKKLFDVEKGELSVGLGITKDEGASISISLKTTP